MDGEEQRQASAQRLFKYLREYVVPYHPYLRRLYRQSGIDVRRLNSPEDVQKLPLINKSHLQSDPVAFILHPTTPGAVPLHDGYETESIRNKTLLKYALQSLVNVPHDYSNEVRDPTFREKMRKRGLLEWQPVHTHVSTGSSGKPTPVVYTHYDLRTFDFSERTLNIFPGAPHMAFFLPVLAKAIVGNSTFETFGGSIIPTDRQLQIFVDGKFGCILAVPSYIVHWLRRAAVLREQQKLAPLRELKRIVLGAEPLSDSLREHIRQLALAVGAPPEVRVLQTYGLTESRWGFQECAEGSGIHLNPKFFLWELIDPQTHQPVTPGEPGVLVFSQIGWRGTVLVRFSTGDLVKGGMRWDRCQRCGYTFPRIFSPICRAEKDFTKLKGTRVDLSLLVQVVRDTPGVRQFQVSLESEDSSQSFSRDLLAIELCPEQNVSRQELKRVLIERIKQQIEVSPDRIFFNDNEDDLDHRLFDKNHIKAEYLIDRRAG